MRFTYSFLKLPRIVEVQFLINFWKNNITQYDLQSQVIQNINSYCHTYFMELKFHLKF